MADKLNVSLVSPERELFTGQVDQVDLPGSEGDLGILPNHAPLMAALTTGVVVMFNGGKEEKYLVQGGFADVTPSGLTILAESAVSLDKLDRDELKRQIDDAKAELDDLTDEGALAHRHHIEGLEAVFNMV